MSAALVPSGSRARLRLGLGAALMLVLLAFGIGVLSWLLAPRGGTELVSATASGAAPAEPTGARSASGVAAGSATGGAAGSGSATGSGSENSGDTGMIYVHVVGHVLVPGLYRLRDGDRVLDAVAAAGGMTADADPAAINLARTLGDGEQLRVPAVGETVTSAASGGAGGAAPAGKVNLNTADATALETLPHVGPALAARIVAWRTAHGRFRSVQDLLGVGGIGEKTFATLKDLVTV